jgi:hypothetical protein
MTDDPRKILLSYAERVSSAVLARLGEENVESIFVSGGAGRGEVAAFRGPSELEIYSDLDLFVVVRSGADLERDRVVAREAAAGVPRTGAGYTIIPRPDVGVFTLEDFLAQKTRPGMVEIAGSHIVLYGSAETPKRARKFVAREIEPDEGLYLIENRLSEIAALSDRLEHESTGGYRRYVRYVLLKSRVDAAAGALIALRQFDPSRAERIRLLHDSLAGEDTQAILPDEARAEIEAAHLALGDLQTALERRPPPDPAAIARTAQFLLDVWSRIARHISGYNTISWDVLFEWRCKRGRRISNTRELLVLALRRSIPLSGVVRRVWGLARLSPVDALRLSGAARMLESTARGAGSDGGPRQESPRGYLTVLDGLTRVFGHTTGDVYARARRLFEETA